MVISMERHTEAPGNMNESANRLRKLKILAEIKSRPTPAKAWKTGEGMYFSIILVCATFGYLQVHQVVI
jgi:hypothetical protein